jgi:hypothetical protein
MNQLLIFYIGGAILGGAAGFCIGRLHRGCMWEKLFRDNDRFYEKLIKDYQELISDILKAKCN